MERRLRDAVDLAAPELEPLLPLLGAVAGVELPSTPETEALDEQFASAKIADTVDRLLGALVPDAALFVIDDVHFMDEASDLLGLYRVESRIDASLEQCRVLVEIAEHLSAALAELKQLRRIEPHVVESCE